MKAMICSLVLVGSAAAAQSDNNATGSDNDPPMYVQISDHQPRIGASSTVYLGDRMLFQRRGEYRDCLVTKFSDTARFNLGAAWTSIEAGEPACKAGPDAEDYTPNYANNNLGGTYDFRVDRDDGETVRICGRGPIGGNAGCFKDIPKSQVQYGPWFIWAPDTVQQTIEYTGKSGDILKFTYAEFTDNMSREAFNREFQIDLAEGNTLAYKGAVIEVEDATNATITYKVIRNFRD